MLTKESIDKLSVLEHVNIDFSPPIWYAHACTTPGLTAAIGEPSYILFTS